MPATIIGSTDVSFGIGSTQTGMVIQSVNSAASSDAVELKNRSGDTTAVIFRNKRTTISVEGAYTTFTGNVASVLAISAGNKFGLTGASYITEVTRTRSADDFERVSVTAVVYDGIT